MPQEGLIRKDYSNFIYFRDLTVDIIAGNTALNHWSESSTTTFTLDFFLIQIKMKTNQVTNIHVSVRCASFSVMITWKLSMML